MAKITFVQPDGRAETVDCDNGQSVMEGARDNAIEGIVAECGGMCSCSTCHCYVDKEWFAKLPEIQDDEAGLLEFAWEPKDVSRLTCQLEVSDDLNGLILHVPEQQL